MRLSSLASLDHMRSLLNDLLAFRQDEFDMAWIRHVWINLLITIRQHLQMIQCPTR